MTSSSLPSEPYRPSEGPAAPSTRGAAFSFLRRFGIIILALLAARVIHGQSRLWRANLADPARFVPGLDRGTPDTALINDPDRTVEFRGDAAWQGILHREGKGSNEILASGASSSLSFRAPTGTALALEAAGRTDRNRHVEPDQLDARLGQEPRIVGGAFVQDLLPRPEDASKHAPFVTMAARVPNRKAMALQWMLAGGVTGLWRVEYGFTQEEIREEARVVNLDTNGSGETVAGVYQGRQREHRAVVQAPLFGGDASFFALYGRALPRRPQEEEFWFCDSSRHLRGRLAYARPAPWAAGGPAGGSLGAWGDFEEAESYSIGRRIPPGSEGVKRFHTARNHALAWELGAEGSRGGADRSLRLAALYRRLDWDSRPPQAALDTRRETLSYNRLGLSFIANLYGGLFKMSELIDARLASGTAELDASGTLRREAFRAGAFQAGAGLSLWRAGLDLRARGLTLEQRFLAVDTSDAFRLRYRGWVAGLTPRLSASLDFRHFSLEAEAAQALPVLSKLRRDGDSGENGPTDPPDGDDFAWGRNGFSAGARLRAGF